MKECTKHTPNAACLNTIPSIIVCICMYVNNAFLIKRKCRVLLSTFLTIQPNRFKTSHHSNFPILNRTILSSVENFHQIKAAKQNLQLYHCQLSIDFYMLTAIFSTNTSIGSTFYLHLYLPSQALSLGQINTTLADQNRQIEGQVCNPQYWHL